MIAVVDAGPLYAAVDTTDRNHLRSVDVFRRHDLEFVIPAMVVAEVTHLVGSRLGPRIEASFLRSLSSLEVEAPRTEDWTAISSFVEQYADFPLGGTDASVVVLAARLDTDLIVTLDRRHFGAIRMKDGRPFRLLPD